MYLNRHLTPKSNSPLTWLTQQFTWTHLSSLPVPWLTR
jgi:hypothetical protein